jgi:hypothetical protein
MASEPFDPPRPETDRQQPASPLAPTRSQAVQRLQIGFVGLGAMLLLIGLANIILDNAQQNQAQVVPEAAPTVAAEVDEDSNDPLADAGVVPAMPEETDSDDADAAAALQP